MYRVAIPIVGKTNEAALKDIELASACNPDFLELRIDFLEEMPDLKALLTSYSNIPKIVTNRTSLEGGKFEGTEIERIGLLENAIEHGAAMVDIELEHYHNFENVYDTQIIVSNHNFEFTPKNLQEIYLRIADKGQDFIKIATTAKNLGDSEKMLKFIKEKSKLNSNFIGICMGEYGVLTRFDGPKFGSYMTFASLSRGKESAPGQVTIEELRTYWKNFDNMKK